MREPTGLDVVYWMSTVPFGDEIGRADVEAHSLDVLADGAVSDLSIALKDLLTEFEKALRIPEFAAWLNSKLTR